MTTQAERDAYAFAESVRKQTIRIASLAGAGRTKEAAEAALALCSQACQQQRRLTGDPEPEGNGEDEDDSARYDLAELNRMTKDGGEGEG